MTDQNAPPYPRLDFDPNGDRLVVFVHGGSMAVAGAELDRLGIMPGHTVAVRGVGRTIERVVVLDAAQPRPDGRTHR